MEETFELVAGHLALDFANTLDNRFAPERLEELLPTYERFLAFARQAGITSAAQTRRLAEETSHADGSRAIRRIVEFREASYALLRSLATGEIPRASDVRVLNRFLRENRVADVVAWNGSEFVQRLADIAATPEGPLWPVIAAATSLLTSADRMHVRECCEDTCRWLYLDRSKNHSRRWCNMAVCGNRTKGRRFSERQRGTHGGASPSVPSPEKSARARSPRA